MNLNSKKSNKKTLTAGLLVGGFFALISLGLFSSENTAMAKEKEAELFQILSKRYALENPAIAMNGKGDVVIVWQENRGKGYDIFGVKTHVNRNFLANPFLVNTYTESEQKSPVIAMDKKGNFVVIWESLHQDGSGTGIYGQRFDRLGEKNGLSFLVNTTRQNSQMSPHVSMNHTGDFAVTWLSETKAGGAKTAFLNLYDRKGDLIVNESGEAVSEIPVTITAFSAIDNPRVALNDSQKVLVTWQGISETKEGSWDIFAQAFDSKGKPKKEEAILISEISGNQINPSVAPLGSDRFLAVWEKNLKSTEYEELELQEENIEGCLLDASTAQKMNCGFEINEVDFNGHDEPEVVPLQKGAIVVWRSREAFTGILKEEGGVAEISQWSLLAQTIDLSGTATGERQAIHTNTEYPYLRARIQSNELNTLGVVWKSRSALSRRGVINFKRFNLGSVVPSAS